MIITNRTDIRIHYRLSGGPTDMTFSEAELEPGESDEWSPPVFTGGVTCRVHFTVAEGREDGIDASEGPWMGFGPSHANISLVQEEDGKAIQVG